MFDIGFSELLMVALVALLVLGPERLPAAARTLGLLMGRIKRSMGSLREELEREVGMDEIRLELRNQEILARERKMLEQTARSLSDTAQELNQPLSAASSATVEQQAATDPTAAITGAAGQPQPAPAAAPGSNPP